jgi:proline iminopeptidase
MQRYFLAFFLGLFTAGCLLGQSVGSSAATVKHLTTSDGVDLYVTVKGKGTPCLYIHGGPGSGSWWLEKFSGDMLEQRFRMIYLDQRGTARSGSPKNDDYSMERMVRDFEEVREALGIREWLTLGHSFGGILQMGYAQRHPRAVKGMIMLNCGLDLNDRGVPWILNACKILGVADPGPYTDSAIPLNDRLNRVYGELREKDLFWKLGYASKKNKEIMDASFNEIPNWNKDLENKAMVIKDYWLDYKKTAPEMNMPVLFFYGKTDWMVGPYHYRGVRFPNMILWGSDAGHVPFLEDKTGLEKAIDSYRKKFAL